MEKTLKKLKVAKGVRCMIEDYCIPPHNKEYLYWFSFDYTHNYDDDLTTCTLSIVKNMEIILKPKNGDNDNKFINGFIYFKQKDDILISNGTCYLQNQ